MKIGLSQIAPVWLNREETLRKVVEQIKFAAGRGCSVVGFGECLVPGYPYWLDATGGAKFNDTFQKTVFAHYLDHAVCIAEGHLQQVCQVCLEGSIACYLGIYERAPDRGNHTGYCSLVFVDSAGEIQSVHRKVVPTYEERLVWGAGDGNGLQVHSVQEFTVGGLNCWENWMPLVRSALYGQGENLHFAVWPGCVRNTQDITRFIAQESRSYVASVSATLDRADIDPSMPFASELVDALPEEIANGGSCLAGPDGKWILEPSTEREHLLTAEVELDFVRRERQNFDPSGHYSRPDLVQLQVQRQRQSVVHFRDA